MYVTTFYSFKGGVGRSMALVNAAFELAAAGRRVLMVDFDLEAPGLDTFEGLRFGGRKPGIIEFVGEYLATGVAPDVGRFLERSPATDQISGELWLMPAGSARPEYGEKFREIDWGELYERHHGYLLFEDLKAQWDATFGPDYVFVDSCTGHTDIGGICTRQLPNAVALFFFPNEQNLRGLTKVVNDIRMETGGESGRRIELHFVMSNVPDLDDEDQILQQMMAKFRSELKFSGDPAEVHRYESLSLLNQVIFAMERPRSRLAGEYRRILQEIVRRNLSDRDGALDYLTQSSGRRHRQARRLGEVSELDADSLLKIEREHSEDGEVLFSLGVIRQEERQLEEASSLFDRAVSSGYREAEIFARRGRVRADIGDSEMAREDALRVLRVKDLPFQFVRGALYLLGDSISETNADLPAIASLSVPDRLRLANSALTGSGKLLPVAEASLKCVVEDESVSGRDRDRAKSELALVHISSGSFKAARDLLMNGRSLAEEMDLSDAFNCGMAIWGADGEVPVEYFRRVVELDLEEENEDRHRGPNYLQRMAVACWAIGRNEEAISFAKEASEAVARVGMEFSCWRYRRVTSNVFRADTSELSSLIEGRQTCVPRFMRAGTTGRNGR